MPAARRGLHVVKRPNGRRGREGRGGRRDAVGDGDVRGRADAVPGGVRRHAERVLALRPVHEPLSGHRALCQRRLCPRWHLSELVQVQPRLLPLHLRGRPGVVVLWGRWREWCCWPLYIESRESLSVPAVGGFGAALRENTRSTTVRVCTGGRSRSLLPRERGRCDVSLTWSWLQRVMFVRTRPVRSARRAALDGLSRRPYDSPHARA